MNIKLMGKELKATDAIKDYTAKKLDRLVKYFGDEFDATVTIRTEKNEQIAEMHVNANGSIYRAETATKDLYASIDKNIDILEGQIRKMKTKKERQNKEASIRQKGELEDSSKKYEVSDEIIKTLYYEAKPMTPEDAKLKLQERPENKFYTFINVETSKVNVIYKLKDGKNYGIVEPE